MPEQERPQIDYYFWLLSDWAYLGGVRLEQMAARHRVLINHVPLRLPDVYARTGGILLAQRSWQRQAYRVEELKRWRERLGMSCNIEPRYFPADIDLASCVVIAAQQRGLAVGALVNALLKAVWADDLDVSDAAVVATILDGHGLDALSLLDAAASERVRMAYAENTDRAVANGVFGSPFYLFDGQGFWGQDRLEILEETVVQRLRRDGLALGRAPQPSSRAEVGTRA